MGTVPRLRALAAWATAVAILAATYAVGTIDPTFDLKADRLVALAALDGLDPYVPLDRLASRFGSSLTWDHVHPRTPGALVLQLPLALVPESALRVISIVSTSAALVATVAIAYRPRPVRWPLAVAVAVLVGVTSVAVEAVTVGALSSVVALLLTVAWWRLRGRDDTLAGVAVAVAITLKLFPWLLAILLLSRRRRAASAAAVAGVILNGIGLAFPGVSMAGAWEALSTAGIYGSSEISASLARLLSLRVAVDATSIALALVGVAVTVGVRRLPDFDRAWFVTLGLSVACAPLVWRHYALVLIPALVWLATGDRRAGRLVAAAAVVVALLPWPLVTVWLIVPLALGVSVAAAAGSGPILRREPVSSQ